MNPKVDAFLERATAWREEMEALRKVCLAHGMEEELKWGKPCYVFEGSNVAIIQGFKDSCALLFPKGALLSDPEGLLEKPGENTQAARRMRFTSLKEIAMRKAAVKARIQEAIEVEKGGLEVEFKKDPEPVPAELEARFKEDPAFKKAFHALTPGRQRAYILHFSSAKQSTTRTSRIVKCMPRILEGKGMND
jgi:uncharacterized protein YdeI (YjbR/CyaY-like superfamily)